MASKHTSLAKYRIKKQLEEINSIQSPDGSTSLVSLYIPPNRVLSDFVQEISNEIGTAANIRSKTTRKNVTTALQILVGKLRLLGAKSPPTGFAMFSGVSAESNKNEYFLVIPPEGNKINRKLYQCDSSFHTEFLEEYLVEQVKYGLLVLDASDAVVAILRGTNLEIIKMAHSGSIKKHRAGGQSAARFQRLHEEAVHRFLDRISNYAKDAFIENVGRDEKVHVKGILIGGPGPTKNKFARGNFLDPRLKEIIIKIVDIGYSANKEGLRELILRSQDTLTDVRYLEEKQLVQKFLDHLYQDTGLAAYGEAEIRNTLEMGAIDTLLLSHDLNKIRVYVECESCKTITGYTINEKDLDNFSAKLGEKTCSACKSSNLTIKETKDLVQELGENAEEIGAVVEIIGSETEEGMQLLQMGGICGILRYKI
ncbi:MAG: peptide chain release factor aRF-1 [Candidatus Hodarchaeota archaeon]